MRQLDSIGRGRVARSAEPLLLEDVQAPPPAVTGSDTVVAGLVAGFIGFAASAGLLAIVGLAEGGTPFLIPAMLGSAVFFSGAASTEAAAVLAYNGLHLVTFVALGVALAGMVRLAARERDGWYPLSLGFLFVAVHALALPLLFTDVVDAVLPVWLLLVTTVLTFAAMAAWLIRWISAASAPTPSDRPLSDRGDLPTTDVQLR